MNPKENHQEFIDALEDRIYVVVMTKYPDDILEVMSERLTWAELPSVLKEQLSFFGSSAYHRSMYVAHYKNLEQPLPSPDV